MIIENQIESPEIKFYISISAFLAGTQKKKDLTDADVFCKSSKFLNFLQRFDQFNFFNPLFLFKWSIGFL